MGEMLMKDGLGVEAVSLVGEVLSLACDDEGWEFSREDFEMKCVEGLAERELKDRVSWVMAVMNDFLPKDFKRAAGILSLARGHWEGKMDKEDKRLMFAGWAMVDYAAEYGLDEPKLSLDLLEEWTSAFSAEFAVRAFIERYPKEFKKVVFAWCGSEDEHVRRLASEGMRPRLPWGKQLPEFIKDPSLGIEVADLLKADESLYVRRSVANHLNDISKDHADRVVEVCEGWLADHERGRVEGDRVGWVVKHATRTLVKAGHAGVFPLLGYTAEPKLKLGELRVEKAKLSLGESLVFSVEICSAAGESQRVVLDYALHLMKANGQQVAKVFKGKELKLEEGERVVFEKSHPLKKITTRRYYSGMQQVEILVNGQSAGVMAKFELEVDV